MHGTTSVLYAGSSNGRTDGSEPSNLGSNPSPAMLVAFQNCQSTLAFLIIERATSFESANELPRYSLLLLMSKLCYSI